MCLICSVSLAVCTGAPQQSSREDGRKAVRPWARPSSLQLSFTAERGGPQLLCCGFGFSGVSGGYGSSDS